MAVSPTDEAIEKWRADGVLEQKIANWNAFRAAGGESPERISPFNAKKAAESRSLGMLATDTIKVLVILVDFSDNPSSGGQIDGQPYQFDSVLFSHPDTHPPSMLNPTGSMTQFYMEASYGQFFVKGDIVGWYRAPQTYEWYVGDNDGMTNGKVLARDAVLLAEAAGVDFSQYDSNLDGQCDGLFVVHAGAGAETGAYGIWSHKSNINPPLVFDGVAIQAYTMQPEEQGGLTNGLSSIGVFTHEYGHFLGLPDLYDVDYIPASSDGLGDWSLMAGGSWNGNGRRPARPDAWCLAELGFVTPVIVTSNPVNVALPCVQYNPVVYRLQNLAAAPQEYWLVENRQQVGFDVALPSNGLLIYHVDLGAPLPNNDPNRYYVALEQADGHDDLAWTNNNQGDGGDPYPGATNNRAFHDQSVPDSKANEYGSASGATTRVGVWSISNSDSIMYADFDIEYSRPWVVPDDNIPFEFDDASGGDGDGQFEAGETIDLYMTARNLMRVAYNARLNVTSSNPDVTVEQNLVLLASVFDASAVTNGVPLQLSLAPDIIPTIDTLWVTILSDSLVSPSGTNEYATSFPVEVNLGGALVVIVDDDGDLWHDERYSEILYAERVPHDVWHVSDLGGPAASDLSGYQISFWITGNSASGVFTSNDVATMRDLMDAGRGVLISSLSGVADLDAIDSVFLHDYLGCAFTGNSMLFPAFVGFDGNPIGDGHQYRYTASGPSTPLMFLNPVGFGEAAFHLPTGTDQIVGITYDNPSSHRTVLLSFPVEHIGDGFVGYDSASVLVSDILDFLLNPTSICCVLRGDVDHSGGIPDIADLVYLVNYGFLGGPAPPCMDEADVNGSGADVIDISDLVYLVNYMFNGGPPPVPCL
ncbi:MAG: M6 family metalloprotease domain-containing protein [bacterium]